MKRIFLYRVIYFACLLQLAGVVQGQNPPDKVAGIPVNYDESLTGSYELPDLFTLNNGEKITTAEEWTLQRRREILELFRTHQFGKAPGRDEVSFRVFDPGTLAFDGKALRKQVTLYFTRDTGIHRADLLIYLPAGAHKPVPLFFNISFLPNAMTVDDLGVRRGTMWDHEGKRVAVPEVNRGPILDVEKFLAEGLGVATIYYGDIEPDFADGLRLGIRGHFLKPGAAQPAGDEWGAIAAWAWGLSGAMDYLETDRQIDARKVALFGVSRLGKTVLWAGASDPRFGMVIASCSGEGGAALSRRNFGETIKHMTAPTRYFYQFCGNRAAFGDDPSGSPVDAHMLVALMAPRPLLLQTGDTDGWSDPKGEFLAAKAAEPVYRLFGKTGPATETMPPAGIPFFDPLGYYMHEGGHGTLPGDYDIFLRFIKKHFADSGLPPVFGQHYVAQDDALKRIFISPVRVMWTSDPAGELVKNQEVLLNPGNSQSDMSRHTLFCALKTTGSDTASLLLDYGRELHGGLQLVMGGSSRREPSLVRIRFGESVGEANSTTYNSDWLMGFSTDDHAKRDIVMEIPRSGLIEVGNTGFRFVRIDLLQANTTINLKEARAVFRTRDIEYTGTFNSSSERLNDIWMTGAYTTHLNMQEYLWDGIKRDRLVWLGDFHPELETITRVFGTNEVVPRSLDLACEQYPLPDWMNGMSSYSMWYLIIHHDWYMQNGDLEFLKSHQGYITGLIDLIDSKISEEGEETLSPFRFLDWPSTPNTKGVEAGYRALLVWALQDASKLCEILGVPETAQKCRRAVQKLNRKILDHNGLKQAAALMAVAGLLDPVKACEEVIAVDGAQRFSTFYGLYMLDALSMAGRHDKALEIIDAYWGGMLDMGATTFWEDFNIEWMENAAPIDEFTPEGKKDIHGDFGAYCYPSYRHSLCHGWASGVTAWLSENVLGIKIVEPGCKTLKIEPHLGNLEWVEGTFPTPYGVVRVKHVKDKEGKIESSVVAPKEITVKQ